MGVGGSCNCEERQKADVFQRELHYDVVLAIYTAEHIECEIGVREDWKLVV